MPKRSKKQTSQPSSHHQAPVDPDFDVLLNFQSPAMSSSNAGGQTSNYSPMPPPPPLLQNPFSQGVTAQCHPHYDPAAWLQFQDQQRQEWFNQQVYLARQAYQAQKQEENQANQVDEEDETEAARTSVASADDEDEVEHVPAPPVKRLTKKGKEMAEKAKWTTADTVLLAEAWTNASEDSVVGISQSETVFWQKVVQWFNENTNEGARNKSQLQGKWNKIKKQCKEFGGVLKKFLEHQRQSGADEKQLYDAAHDQYREVYGTRFSYEPCYNVLKDAPKFWSDHSVAKRTAASFVDLGDDGPSFPPSQSSGPDPPMAQLFGEDPIRKPRGRNVSRRLSSSSDVSSGRGGSSGSEAALSKLDRMLKLQEEAVRKIDEDRVKVEEERERKEQHRLELKVMEATRVLQQPIPTGLPEDELEMVKASRKALIDKYGKYFGRF
jgi:hypothetical protein